jgi:iron complex outermembrane receptor protein
VIGPVSLFTQWEFGGRTKEAWDADNSSFQRGYNTLDIRLGLKGDRWSLMASVLNATDTKYNEEFVEGGFTFPALPRRVLVWFTTNFGQ